MLWCRLLRRAQLEHGQRPIVLPLVTLALENATARLRLAVVAAIITQHLEILTPAREGLGELAPVRGSDAGLGIVRWHLPERPRKPWAPGGAPWNEVASDELNEPARVTWKQARCVSRGASRAQIGRHVATSGAARRSRGVASAKWVGQGTAERQLGPSNLLVGHGIPEGILFLLSVVGTDDLVVGESQKRRPLSRECLGAATHPLNAIGRLS